MGLSITYKQIIFTNVGNPHALGQKPLTFPRQVYIYIYNSEDFNLLNVKLTAKLVQVVALCQAPFLLDDPNVGMLFPADAIARAKHYLSLTSGGLGIYYYYVHQTHYLASCQKVIYFSLSLCVCVCVFIRCLQ